MNAETPESFSDEDVKAVVRLLGEVAGSTEAIEVRRRQLCTGLASLIDADVWSWVLVKDDPTRADLIGYAFVDGGWAAQEARQRELYRHGTMSEHCRFVNDSLRGKSRHETSARHDIVSDDAWYGSTLVREYFGPSGYNEFMTSVYPLGDQILSSVIMVRRAGKPPFEPRAKALVHLVVGQIDWLHRADPKIEIANLAPTLTMRQRQVLFMLLEGEGRKQIARKLGITPHTAREHLEAVYAHFGVNSQSELVSHFYRGGGARH